MGLTSNRISAYVWILLTGLVLAGLVLPQFNPDYIASKSHEEIADSERSFEPPETDSAGGGTVQDGSRHVVDKHPASSKVALLDLRSAVGFLTSRSPTGPPTLPL